MISQRLKWLAGDEAHAAVGGRLEPFLQGVAIVPSNRPSTIAPTSLLKRKTPAVRQWPVKVRSASANPGPAVSPPSINGQPPYSAVPPVVFPPPRH